MTQLRFYGDRPPGITETDLPGRLVVLEGTDGVGRSTQIALLKEWLEDSGYAVLDTGLRRSPLAGAGIERAKRGHTLDPVTLSLFYATDFADRLERLIFPGLRAGMVVLTDRYIYSLVARSAVRGVSPAWLQEVFGFALVPDQVFYLDIDVEHLLPRVLGTTGFDFWESGQDFLGSADVYQSFVRYQQLLLGEFQQLANDYDFKVIDARRPIDEVFVDLREALRQVLGSMAQDRPSSTPAAGAPPG